MPKDENETATEVEGVTSVEYAALVETVNNLANVVAEGRAENARLVARVDVLERQVSDLASTDAQRSDTGAILTDAEAEHVRFVLNKYHAHERG